MSINHPCSESCQCYMSPSCNTVIHTSQYMYMYMHILQVGAVLNPYENICSLLHVIESLVSICNIKAVFIVYITHNIVQHIMLKMCSVCMKFQLASDLCIHCVDQPHSQSHFTMSLGTSLLLNLGQLNLNLIIAFTDQCIGYSVTLHMMSRYIHSKNKLVVLTSERLPCVQTS